MHSVAAAVKHLRFESRPLSRPVAESQDSAGHSVVVIDPKGDLVEDVLTRIPEERAGDVIVLDPPTFSRTHRGKTFQVESDYETLLSAAIEVVEREGQILLSTNCSMIPRLTRSFSRLPTLSIHTR